MHHNLMIRIIIENSLPNIDFGVQKCKSANFGHIEKQHSNGGTLQFDFSIKAKRESFFIDIRGDFVQGTKHNRFFYLNNGSFVGQTDAIASNRLKIPFFNVEEGIIMEVINHGNAFLVTRINGTSIIRRPTATVKPFNGWQIEYNN